MKDLVAPGAIVAELDASSKKEVLLAMAELASQQTELSAREIFEALMARERLGTTGVGRGVAIPHARLEGVTQCKGFFAHLRKPVDFDSIDDQPVDLVFLLLAPAIEGADHLKALARVSRLLRSDEACAALRNVSDTKTLYAGLTGLEAGTA